MQSEVKWLADYLDAHPMLEDMDKAIHEACHWVHSKHDYPSKHKRIKEWSPEKADLYNMFTQILAGVFTAGFHGITYQALIGYIAGNVGCNDPLDRAKCAAELIAIAYQHGLVVITKTSDQTMMITTEYELEEDIPTFVKHMPEWAKPKQVTYNPILGNRFKQHDHDICVEHIDRMNAIPLCLDFRVINGIDEEPKNAPETQEERVQWDDFRAASRHMYSEVLHRNNRFHLEHSVDTRGRTYCGGYYINYQGASFKKAIVQL